MELIDPSQPDAKLLPAGEEKRGPGRPAAVLDLIKVEALCQVHATDEEIADHFGVSTKTLERRRRDDPAFAALFQKARADGKISLRRAQFQKALKGDTGMLCFLGKQILGQKDRHEISGPNNGPIELSYIQNMLEQLPEEEFRRWAANNGVELPDDEPSASDTVLDVQAEPQPSPEPANSSDDEDEEKATPDHEDETS